MNYQLVADSCCELTDFLKQGKLRAQTASLSILLDGVNYIDDETLDIPRFLQLMAQSKRAPVSACPSPEQYLMHFRKADATFVVTLSSKLSGSYNSARNAQSLLEEEAPERRVHVFDSLSASAGELAVCLKIAELTAQGCDFDSIVNQVEHYIAGMKTYFILETLDTLIKAGRMSRITGYVATTMSLRPIMGAEQGEIRLVEKARGSLRAFTRLVDLIGEGSEDLTGRTLVITHCYNERQANFIRAEALKRYPFRDAVILPTRGISTMYANSGGVIIAY